MTDTTKATRATIQIEGTEIDCFVLPNASESAKTASESAKITHSDFFKAIKALLGKGCTSCPHC